MIKSVYIHIPFCKTICSYCDFCKIYYNEYLADKYLDALFIEVKNNYKGEYLNTLYIGGGTPSTLSIKQLNKLFEITKIFNLNNDYEFTIEVNVNDITEELLVLLKTNKVNRLSIGIETINDKHLGFLNRSHDKNEVINSINLAKKHFDNITVDLMYAFPKETITELDVDLEFVKEIDIPHISIYSLIIEEHTKLYIEGVKSLPEELESDMYYHIIDYLEGLGYKHYEISNFSKMGYESKHNTTYWNNEKYYGFGLGSSGYIGNKRYTNTRSINNYLSCKYNVDICIIDKKINMENHMILGLRKINGVSKTKFLNLFGLTIYEAFDIIDLVKENLLIDEEDRLYIPKDKLYLQNSILINFIGGNSE